MSNYQMLLIVGVLMLLVGSLKYLRGMVNGQTSLFSMFLTVCGGAALIGAERFSTNGVSINDVQPALLELFTQIGNLVN